jgi:hypothetical protein
LAIGGTADMVSSAFRNTILQEAATDDVRGRLQGVFTVVVAGGPRVADAVHARQRQPSAPRSLPQAAARSCWWVS